MKFCEKHFAFTIAEILVSLTIIGVISAIVLPALHGNVNEKAWETKRGALYARMSQAIALMPSLNGYGVVVDENGYNEEETKATAARKFLEDGLSQNYRIARICNADKLERCGINIDKSSLVHDDLTGVKTHTPIGILSDFYGTGIEKLNLENSYQVASVGFETVNGESILLLYNPWCTGNPHNTNGVNYMHDKICANFIYDLNGKKGPNRVGKDMGVISALYSSDSELVAPVPFPNVSVGKIETKSLDKNEISKEKELNKEIALTKTMNLRVAKAACSAQGGRLPNLDEAIAMKMNIGLYFSQSSDFTFWTNSIANGGESAWAAGNPYRNAVNTKDDEKSLDSKEIFKDLAEKDKVDPTAADAYIITDVDSKLACWCVKK